MKKLRKQVRRINVFYHVVELDLMEMMFQW